MKINCAQSTGSNNNKGRWSGQQVFADDLSHQSESFLYIWRPLKPLKTTAIAQKIQLLSVLWHFWSAFLTSLISYSEESFNPPCTCYYLSTRCRHTSPTAGVQISIPPLAERNSRYTTPQLQFISSQLMSSTPQKIKDDLSVLATLEVQSRLSPVISWSLPCWEGDPGHRSVSLQPLQG